MVKSQYLCIVKQDLKLLVFKYLLYSWENFIGIFTSETAEHLINVSGDLILVECPYFLFIGAFSF